MGGIRMRRLILFLLLAFLSSAASAITPEGYAEYEKKIKTYAEEERYYRNNADYCDRKLRETDWWNLWGKARWGLEKWSNTAKADEANRNEEFYAKQRDEELAAERRRREAEAKRHEDAVNDSRKDLQELDRRIRELRKDERHYQENVDFCNDKLKETSGWNLPAKLRWWMERHSNENSAEAAADKRRQYEKERAGVRDELKEEQDDYAFRKRLQELKDKAMTGSQRDKDYYDMMDKAYDYYKLKEKYEETPTWSLFGGVLPKIYYKARLDHALEEAREAQKRVYPHLYGESRPTPRT